MTGQAVIHKPRGQDEMGGWLVKCPRLSTQGRYSGGLLNGHVDRLLKKLRKLQKLHRLHKWQNSAAEINDKLNLLYYFIQKKLSFKT